MIEKRIPVLFRKGTVLNLRDDNADAYILAEGITDANAKKAITYLVTDLKAINTVEADFVNFETPASSKRKAIYPYPGTVASENKRNLINPLDADAANRLVISGTPDISAKGVSYPSGASADTKLVPSTALVFEHHEYDIAISEDLDNTADNVDLGSGNSCRLSTKTGATFATYSADGSTSVLSANPYDEPSSAFVQMNKSSNAIGDAKLRRNGRLLISSTLEATGNNGAISMRINLSTKPSNRRYSFVGIGDYIPDAANELYLKAIENYNYRMGRLNTLNLSIEGHSFTTSNKMITPIRTGLKLNSLTPYQIRTFGVSGSNVAQMVARADTCNASLKSSDLIPFKNCLVLWIGTNDLSTLGTATTTYAAMKAYIISELSAGWEKVIAFTCTPEITNKLSIPPFNELMRTDLITVPNVHVIDTDLITELANPADTNIYSDGLHMTTLGYSYAIAPLVAKITELYG